MKIESGAVAYVSGGGSGIGRGIAMNLAELGVRVGVVDILEADAIQTVALIEEKGGQAIAIEADVSDAAATEAAADKLESALGAVSIVCNNAGVAMHGVPMHEIKTADWDWVIGVNIYGIIHGIQTFVPRLLELGKPAHIVNTASIGGFQVNAGFLTGAYSMTKFAALALTEGLQNELADSNIGVSVLAPAAVDSGFHLAERSRPERFGGPYVRPENHFMGDIIKDSTQPHEIGAHVVQAILNDKFYIFTHPETKQWLEERHARIIGAFD
ncbi:MAG: 3-oxoacyl-ACP reductase [Hyphomicrobiales bacterium]|nr:MAG: 3-oxoacyl-ACP reductase [Hyphomicrobiales bacterium]